MLMTVSQFCKNRAWTQHRGRMRAPAITLFFLFVLCTCAYKSSKTGPADVTTPEFEAYWNSGKAEIARYELQQARYGKIHRGEMVLISVTEPFRTDEQVKAETPEGMQNAINVLKVQQMRRFATGIYDYALTTTSFAPLSGYGVLKITGSAVDWCGQAWLQLNRKGTSFRVESRSYFENPGDSDYTIPTALHEDEIWQIIRISPEKLPTGSVMIVPSLTSARLRHRKLAAESVQAELQNFARLKQKEYSLLYAPGTPDERKVVFIFEREFPHKILEYRETYSDVVGAGGKKEKLTTVARLKKTLHSAYWQQNNPENQKDRKALGIRGFD